MLKSYERIEMMERIKERVGDGEFRWVDIKDIVPHPAMMQSLRFHEHIEMVRKTATTTKIWRCL